MEAENSESGAGLSQSGESPITAGRGDTLSGDFPTKLTGTNLTNEPSKPNNQSLLPTSNCETHITNFNNSNQPDELLRTSSQLAQPQKHNDVSNSPILNNKKRGLSLSPSPIKTNPLHVSFKGDSPRLALTFDHSNTDLPPTHLSVRSRPSVKKNELTSKRSKKSIDHPDFTANMELSNSDTVPTSRVQSDQSMKFVRYFSDNKTTPDAQGSTVPNTPSQPINATPPPSGSLLISPSPNRPPTQFTDFEANTQPFEDIPSGHLLALVKEYQRQVKTANDLNSSLFNELKTMKIKQSEMDSKINMLINLSTAQPSLPRAKIDIININPSPCSSREAVRDRVPDEKVSQIEPTVSMIPTPAGQTEPTLDRSGTVLRTRLIETPEDFDVDMAEDSRADPVNKYLNRTRDRKIVFKSFGICSADRSDREVVLTDKTGEYVLCNGYDRIVFGDHGPYFEVGGSEINQQVIQKVRSGA